MKNFKIFTTILTLLFIFLGCSNTSVNSKKNEKEQAKEKPVLALLLTRGEEDMFWGKFRDFMKEACYDLGMELKVFYANGEHLRMIEQAKLISEGKMGKVDVIVFPNFKKAASYIINYAENAKIPVFVVNSGILEDENLGEPREKYKYWIGELTPNDEKAGELLAKNLVDTAIKKSSYSEITLNGIEGIVTDTASIERKKGFEKFLKENKRRNFTTINKGSITFANWDPQQAYEVMEDIVNEQNTLPYIIWCASDGMALGTIEAAKKLKLNINDNFFTGGVDWSDEGVEAVKNGTMVATIGGHYMDGAWAAVMIYDYLNGIDFINDGLRQKTDMYALTSENIAEYNKKLAKENWSKIDFRKFSKKYNKNLKKYEFGLNAVLNQLK